MLMEGEELGVLLRHLTILSILCSDCISGDCHSSG